MKEGLALSAMGHSPYAGDVYHQPPLLLAVFRPGSGLSHACEMLWVAGVFCFLDFAAAWALKCASDTLCGTFRPSTLAAEGSGSLPRILSRESLPRVIFAT